MTENQLSDCFVAENSRLDGCCVCLVETAMVRSAEAFTSVKYASFNYRISL